MIAENSIKFPFQWGYIYLDDCPDLIPINRKIVMDEDIAKTDYLTPRDLIIPLL